MAKAKQERVVIITPPGRLSFPNLFTPRQRNNGKSWDCVVVWPAGTDLSELKAALKKVAEGRFGAGILSSKKFNQPLKFWEEDGEKGESYGYPEGSTWASFATKVPPPPIVLDKLTGRQVFDDDGHAIIYSGCWVQVKGDVYAYDNEQRGVNFGLTTVCKVRDDDRFAGRFVDAAKEAEEFGIDPVAAGFNPDAAPGSNPWLE